MGMSSINTNISAMTALQSLQQTSKELLTTQNRISTGLAVSSAKDNASVYAIAQGQRADLSSLDAEARARLVTVLQRAIDANCTVGRTLKAGASVELTVTGER